MQHVIVIDGVTWNVVDAANFVVSRNGRQARIVWKAGKAFLFMRNILTGRFRTQRVTVR